MHRSTLALRSISFAALVLILCAFTPVVSHAMPSADTPVQLLNPQFDPPWTKRPDMCGSGATLEEVQVPNGWEPYWACQQPSDATDINRTPEFRMVDMAFPYRVRSPGTALRYFNFWALNRSAGVYQHVPNIRPGTRLRFSLWVQLWTSQADVDPPRSIEPGNLQARLCVDTLGRIGTPNLADPDVVCGAWARPWDAYERLEVEAQAKSNGVTVILNSAAEFAVKHNDVHADDAELIIVDAPPAATLPVAPARAPQPNVTTTVVTPVYTDRSDVARVVYRARKGTALKVRGVSADGAWWRVVTNNRTTPLGWVKADAASANVDAEALRQASEPYTVVLATSVRLHTAPRASATRIASVPINTRLVVTGKSQDSLWWQVHHDGVAAPNTSGWVLASLVTASAPADAQPVVAEPG